MCLSAKTWASNCRRNRNAEGEKEERRRGWGAREKGALSTAWSRQRGCMGLPCREAKGERAHYWEGKISKRAIRRRKNAYSVDLLGATSMLSEAAGRKKIPH